MSEVDKLLDALERQRELIAALRNEIATKDKQIALLADKLQAGAYHDKDTALIMEQQAKRINELESNFAAANEALRLAAERVADVEAMYEFEATHNGLRMIEIGGLKKRIAELEAENGSLQESLDGKGRGMWEVIDMKDRALEEYAQIVAELKAQIDEYEGCKS